MNTEQEIEGHRKSLKIVKQMYEDKEITFDRFKKLTELISDLIYLEKCSMLKDNDDIDFNYELNFDKKRKI